MNNNNTEKNTHLIVEYTENDFEFLIVNQNDLPTKEKEYYDKYSSNKGLFIFELAFWDYNELSASVSFLKYISNMFIDSVINATDFNLRSIPMPISVTDVIINSIIKNTPYAIGSKYVTSSWVESIFAILNDTYLKNCNLSGESPRLFISHKNNKIIIPSRIYFHLVENKEQDDYPFAFMATYTSLINNTTVHEPLKNALVELADKPSEIRTLIKSITDVADESLFIKHLLDSGDVFYPIKFSNEEAYCFLKETPLYEKCGIICRVPQWYNDSKNILKFDYEEIKQYKQCFLNKMVINQLTPHLIYQGVNITIEDAKNFLLKNEGLEKIKGRWVEINHEQLSMLLNEYESLVNDGTTLLDVFKYKSGITEKTKNNEVLIEFSRENFIEEFIKKNISSVKTKPIPIMFSSVLRNYQKEAYDWLYSLKMLGMGACLADDMGLGKTVEVLAFLEAIRGEDASKVLVIVPATLVDNWRHEVNKFVPDMDLFVLKGSNEPDGNGVNGYLTICTYQTVIKSKYLYRVKWDVVVLDEAQAIKNYYTLQTQKIKQLKSTMKIAMTGTPIENNILELWSIFDFINPGLLGSRKEFNDLYKRLYKIPNGIFDIKSLINPFILRRLKVDKSIISDLPEKNDIDVTISLTKEQIILYKNVVDTMNYNIHNDPKVGRERIIVMTTLMKLKQVCNHPSQYYGQLYYDPNRSGKFLELKRICETIKSKNERVLVFTQFKEIIPALDKLLEGVFCKKGFTIDGDTAIKKRDEYVQTFQKGESPYMILSLKTAGVGLNLTAAQNVIHFDLWWNPAVENQATDRAYRIGQNMNVTVYRFISADTIEEVINTMLETKQELADSLINDENCNIINKLSTEEILKVIRYGGFSTDE